MLRSLSAAVSGLRNHQTKLDVVGNNIANVNTVGYKYSTARFQDIFSQTVRGATAPLAGRGGINPMQIGLGMGIASIGTVHTQGAITSTGRETDLAIEGRGFFVVSDGQQNYYTRDGSFVRDASGVLVNADGLTLMGWIPDQDGVIDTSQPLGRINIPLGEDMVAQATENILFAGNLDSAAAAEVNYHDDNFEALRVNGLPPGAFSIGEESEDSGNVRMVASTTSWDYFTVPIGFGDDGDVMHFIEVANRTDDYITLNIVELDKTNGSRNVETVRVQKNDDGDYQFEDITVGESEVSYNDVVISSNIVRGERFLLDFGSNDLGENESMVLSGTSGIAEGQTIAFHDGFADEDGMIYTMHMNERSGEVFFGSLSADAGEIENVGPDAVTFQFEPYSYDTYVYDSLGNRHELTVTFTKHPDNNTWSYTVQHTDPSIRIEDPTNAPYTGRLVFTPGGRFDADASDVPDFSFDPGTDAYEVTVSPLFGEVTQFSLPSNLFAREQDGFQAGELAAFNIESTGIVSGTYTNGMVRELAQIAMASFANPEGLLKMGSNLYDISSNSGDPSIGLPGEMGRGMIQSSSLEMSNVDLANEFTEMITTSRAFQANTRMISTSDEVLVELINVKR